MYTKDELDGWTEEDEVRLNKLIDKRLKVSRDHGRDLKYVSDIMSGEMSENKLLQILSGDIEVKTDNLAGKYGSIYVEYTSDGKPSGIQNTNSNWWASVLGGPFNSEVIILMKTSRLKAIADTCEKKSGGDRKATVGASVPLEKLLKP